MPAHYYCTFLCRCFCTTTTWNFQKLPVPVHFLFSLPLIFTLQATSISHFLTANVKFSSYFDLLKRNWPPLLFIFSSFSVIHINVDIKINSKERIGVVCCCFLSLKVWVAMQFTAETHGYLKCKILPQLTWRGWCMYERFSENQNLLDA